MLKTHQCLNMGKKQKHLENYNMKKYEKKKILTLKVLILESTNV